MTLLPLQVLRLHSLVSIQKTYTHGGHLIDKAQLVAQLACSGLNLAFPACPACAHKVTTSSHSKWSCQKCHLNIDQREVAWTFRLSLSLISIPSLSNASGRLWEKEIPGSILGIAAQSLFGCSAVEWVGIVESAANDAAASEALVSMDYLAQQMAVLADLVSFPSFNCLMADLRKSSSQKYAQHKVTRIGIAKTHTGSALVPEIVPLRWLWEMLVCESFVKASADNTGNSAGQKKDFSLRVSDLFAASRCLATAIDVKHQAETTVNDRAQIIDYDSVVYNWKAQEPTESFCIYPSLSDEPQSETVCYQSQEQHDLMDKGEVDQLFDHWSQLFVDNSQSHLYINVKNPKPKADNPLGIQSHADQSLSSHFLSESYYDECLQSLFVNSQKHLENTAGSVRDTQNSRFSNENASFDNDDLIMMDALSFSELIASNGPPLSLDTRPPSALSLIPPRTPSANARANFNSQSAFNTPLRQSGREEHVLAQETPVMQTTPIYSVSAFSANNNIERATSSVKETPLLRAKSLNDARGLSPSLPPSLLALSQSHDNFVPETPAKDAGSRIFSKLTQPRVFKKHRSVLDNHISAESIARSNSNNRRRLSGGVSKHRNYPRPPRLRKLSDAQVPGVVPETPAAQAPSTKSKADGRTEGQTDLPRFAKSRSTGTSK